MTVRACRFYTKLIFLNFTVLCFAIRIVVRPLTPGDLYPKICARLPGEKRVVRFDKLVVEEFSELLLFV
jgi:hypothetical protein